MNTQQERDMNKADEDLAYAAATYILFGKSSGVDNEAVWPALTMEDRARGYEIAAAIKRRLGEPQSAEAQMLRDEAAAYWAFVKDGVWHGPSSQKAAA